MNVVEQDTSWMEDAACAGVDPDLFFPELGGSGIGTKAKEVCAECPVRQECLDYAVRRDRVLPCLPAVLHVADRL